MEPPPQGTFSKDDTHAQVMAKGVNYLYANHLVICSDSVMNPSGISPKLYGPELKWNDEDIVNIPS